MNPGRGDKSSLSGLSLGALLSRFLRLLPLFIGPYELAPTPTTFPSLLHVCSLCFSVPYSHGHGYYTYIFSVSGGLVSLAMTRPPERVSRLGKFAGWIDAWTTPNRWGNIRDYTRRFSRYKYYGGVRGAYNCSGNRVRERDREEEPVGLDDFV